MNPVGTEGLDLFRPPHSGVDTSRDAATAKLSTAARDRERLYAAIVVNPGVTCEALCDAFGMDGNSVRPRLWELEGKNGFPARIRKTAERYPTRHRTAHGYVILQAKQEAA